MGTIHLHGGRLGDANAPRGDGGPVAVNPAGAPDAARPDPIVTAPHVAAQPRCIVIDETIGWMAHGALRQFTEGQQVTHAGDIADLIARGAQYREVKP